MENLDTHIFWEMYFMYKMNGLGPKAIFTTIILFSPYKIKKHADWIPGKSLSIKKAKWFFLYVIQ